MPGIANSIHCENLAEVRAYLAEGGDPSAVHQNSTLLQHCRMCFRTSVMRCLVNGGADVNDPGPRGIPPLALFIGHLKYVRLLVNAGADVNARLGDGTWIIHHAAERNSSVILSILLENGADPNVRDTHGRSSLFYAIKNTRPRNVDLLVGAGCSLEARDNENLLFLREIFKVGRERCLPELAPLGLDLHAEGENGETALHIACRWGKRPQTILTILDAGININSIDRTGATPLFYAIQHGRKMGAVGCYGPLAWSVLSQIIDSGGEINRQDASGDTPLHTACAKIPGVTIEMRKKAISFLLDHGADKNIANDAGQTPKDVAHHKYRYLL